MKERPIDKARELRDKLFPDKKWADIYHVNCAKMSVYYEQDRQELKGKVVEAIRKRIEMAREIIKENKESIKKYPHDVNLKMESITNEDIIADYLIFEQSIEKLFSEVSDEK